MINKSKFLLEHWEDVKIFLLLEEQIENGKVDSYFLNVIYILCHVLRPSIKQLCHFAQFVVIELSQLHHILIKY